MTTAIEVINRAMRKIGILGAGNTSSAGDTTKGLDNLNSMLHGFELKGIKLNHVDLASADSLPYPANHIKPITDCLVKELYREYQRPIGAMDAQAADDGMRELQNYYIESQDLKCDPMIAAYYSPNRTV